MWNERRVVPRRPHTKMSLTPVERSVFVEVEPSQLEPKRRGLFFKKRKDTASPNLTKTPKVKPLEVQTASIERNLIRSEAVISNLHKKVYLMEREITQLKDLNRRLTYECERLEVQAVSVFKKDVVEQQLSSSNGFSRYAEEVNKYKNALSVMRRTHARELEQLKKNLEVEVHTVKKSFVEENEGLYEMFSQLNQQVFATYERQNRLSNKFRTIKTQYKEVMRQLEALIDKEKLEKQSVSELAVTRTGRARPKGERDDAGDRGAEAPPLRG